MCKDDVYDTVLTKGLGTVEGVHTIPSTAAERKYERINSGKIIYTLHDYTTELDLRIFAFQDMQLDSRKYAPRHFAALGHSCTSTNR